GLDAALKPPEGALTSSQVPGDHRAIVVGPRERRRQADHLVEQPGGALEVAVAEVALARDEEELLRALRNVTVATEPDPDVAGAGFLVASQGRDSRPFEDHQPPEAHVAFVRQPLPVPPDAIGAVRLTQRGQAERLEDLLAPSARLLLRLRLSAVVLVSLLYGVGGCQRPSRLEGPFRRGDVAL